MVNYNEENGEVQFKTIKSIRKLSHDKPGKCTSIDQIVSAQPGLVPRMSGCHTRDRITAATCFFEYKSSFGYTHLCTSTDQEQTLISKAAYEKLADTHGVQIEAYHADNGRFAEKGFREAVANSNQTITFCGVGSHHQNALVERYIEEITKLGRTVLLHAKRHWKEAISTVLWPFAIRAVKDMRNHLKLDLKG